MCTLEKRKFCCCYSAINNRRCHGIDENPERGLITGVGLNMCQNSSWNEVWITAGGTSDFSLYTVHSVSSSPSDDYMYIESVLLVKCYSPPPVNESGVFVPKKAYKIEYNTKSQICLSYLLMDSATFISVYLSRCPQKYMLYSTYLVGKGGGSYLKLSI